MKHLVRTLRRQPRLLGAALALVLAALGGAYWAHSRAAEHSYKTSDEASSVYVRFDMEAYDSIQKNYWNTLSDADLSDLFRLSLEKAEGVSSVELSTSTRSATAAMLGRAFSQATSTEARRQLALNTLIVALYNLAPLGRDALFSSAQTTQLRQEVANVNPSNDLYATLGLSKGASIADVGRAARTKEALLEASNSPEAAAELKQVAYAAKVLSSADTKARYDESGIEPTGFGHLIGRTLYFDMSKMSPTTLQEFALAVDSASTTPGIDSMIIDLRGNVGGAFDLAPALLGLFLGPNQYAFDIYAQGKYDVERTTEPAFGELERYQDIAILTDSMTQSTAEVIAAAFKRFRLAHIVGGATRGWGTVENTYPLATDVGSGETYSLLLVNHLTLDDRNLPIEGRGVEPDVDIAKAGWQDKLARVFSSSSLIRAVEGVVPHPPQH